MGLRCLSLDPGMETPASAISNALVGALDDPEVISKVLYECENVTFENEFIPATAIMHALKLSGRVQECILPGVECLGVIQDKLRQRQAYAQHSVPSPIAIEIEGDGTSAIDHIGFPMVLKARFGGYDGKGTRYARNDTEFRSYQGLFMKGGWMAESYVEFVREVAVMVCRSGSQTICFPTMVTQQKNHVCDLVFPSDKDASKIATSAVESVGGYGLFGVELFEMKDGSFQINEIAPRPHNSGHYTLDWGGISQFEAHIRLVIGLTVPKLDGQETCMANLLGQEGAKDYRNAIRKVNEADPGIRVHWYGKSEIRTGRKMGHLNAVGNDCIERVIKAQTLFYESWQQG